MILTIANNFKQKSMKKRFLLTFILAMIATASFAQDKPGWIYNKPKPSNNTYLYVVESATGLSEIEARNQAFARVFQSTAMRLGQPIDSDEINRAVQQGTDFNVISSQYNIPINKICEYTEKISRNNYRVYILCQVAKAGNVIVDFDYDFDGCYDKKKYKNGPALLKSMIIPGWGQMSKNHYVEGVLTLSVEGAFAAGAIVTYKSAQSYYDKIKAGEGDVSSHIKYYNSNKTMNHVCLGAAAAIYAINLYRAVAAKPKYKKSYALNPSVIPADNSYAYGVSLIYNF